MAKSNKKPLHCCYHHSLFYIPLHIPSCLFDPRPRNDPVSTYAATFVPRVSDSLPSGYLCSTNPRVTVDVSTFCRPKHSQYFGQLPGLVFSEEMIVDAIILVQTHHVTEYDASCDQLKLENFQGYTQWYSPIVTKPHFHYAKSSFKIHFKTRERFTVVTVVACHNVARPTQ